MKCPIDNSDLQMSERQGVEIDYCPQCRGVWLDRGELDKIIERSETEAPAQSRPQQPDQEPGYPPANYNKHGGGGHGYKKRKSFLGELFD